MKLLTHFWKELVKESISKSLVTRSKIYHKFTVDDLSEFGFSEIPIQNIFIEILINIMHIMPSMSWVWVWILFLRKRKTNNANQHEEFRHKVRVVEGKNPRLKAFSDSITSSRKLRH